MAYPLNHLNKIDQYTTAIGQAQFSDAKREAMELSKGIPWDDDQLQKLAKLKGKSIQKCVWCGKSVMVDNSRQKLTLCYEDSNGRSVIDHYMRTHKLTSLSEKDREAILNSKTIRRGSGKAFN